MLLDSISFGQLVLVFRITSQIALVLSAFLQFLQSVCSSRIEQAVLGNSPTNICADERLRDQPGETFDNVRVAESIPARYDTG